MMRLGVCWYPEQEPPSSWRRSVAMMAGEGLEVVRIGEFAWSSIEPARDRFRWDWLDEVVELLREHGCRIVLGTPTATPPRWLTSEVPSALAVGPHGRRRQPGSRRHICLTSAAYRAESRRITGALVERYGSHPAVEAWQLDNEVGNHDSARCWCPECEAGFRAWLRQRYGTIEHLDERWGTAFWSQTYGSFDEVELPVPTLTAHNPALLLAHRRFSSHQAVTFLAEQAAIVRAGSPGRAVAVNEYAGDLHVDLQALASELGATCAHDNYPHGAADGYEVVFRHLLVNGAVDGRAGWVMEQQPGHINWTPTNPAVAAGQVVRWCWQALYAGIDTLLFFRWQAARFGQEQYHSGLLRHDGTPDLGLHELRSFREELERVRRDAPELLVRPPATVAVLSSYEDAWAIEIDPHRWGLDHRSLVTAAVAACCRLGLVTDVVAPERDLSAYELVLAPALHLATPERLERLEIALDRGATVVLGPRSLVKDADDAWVAEPVPAGLASRLGARLGAFTGELRGARLAPWGVEAGGWTEAFELDPLEPAAVLASYEGGGPALHGRPASVRRGGLVALGAASADAWTALLGSLTGRTPAAAGTWVVERGQHRLEVDVTW